MPAARILMAHTNQANADEVDQYGPRGTYGCACLSRDAHTCILMRYGCDCGDPGEHCECVCHQWDDDTEEVH